MDQTLWWVLTLAVSCGAVIGYWMLARRQVRRATADLRVALERERQVVARVSHRLRNPLTVIYGFSETLVDTSLLKEPSEIANVASLVAAEALDVSRTVEDLVTAQEVSRGDLQIRSVGFDPREEIDRVVTPFRRLGSKISVEAWSGTATSDPIRFRHVLQSLVSNAVRHGGSEISIYADLDGDVYRCTVADDGTGLPDETADRLFGSFRGTSPAVHDDSDGDEAPTGATSNEPSLDVDPGGTDGLGIGLAVAISVSRHLGGALTYESAPDFAAFTLSLPTAAWPGPLVPMNPPEPLTVDGAEDDDGGDTTAEAEGPFDASDAPTVSFASDDAEADVDDPRNDGAESANGVSEELDEEALRS